MKNRNRLITKLIRLIITPKDFYIHRIQPIIRNRLYPSCDCTAVVNRPLKFNPKGVTLGKNVYVFKHARISCIFEYAGNKYYPRLEIGEDTKIQQNVHITCAQKVKIGKSCAITHNVTITDIDHSFEYKVPNISHPGDNPLIIKGGGRNRRKLYDFSKRNNSRRKQDWKELSNSR